MKPEIMRKAGKQAGLVQAYQNVFSSVEGKQVLFDLMKKHNILSESFDGNVNNALVKIGERKVVLGILDKLNYNVNKMKERIDEYANEEI